MTLPNSLSVLVGAVNARTAFFAVAASWGSRAEDFRGTLEMPEKI